MAEPAHDELAREAMQLLRDRREDRALEILERLVAAMPHREDLQIALAYCQGRLGNLEPANRICARLESLDDSLRVRQLRAFLGRQAHRFGTASIPSAESESARSDAPLPGMAGIDRSEASLASRLTDIQQRLEREIEMLRARESAALDGNERLQQELDAERQRVQALEGRAEELEELLAEFGLESLREDDAPLPDAADNADEIERLERRIQEKDETLSSLFRRNAELTQRVSALEEEVYSGANELNRTVRDAQELHDRVQELARELAVREEAAAQWEARAAQSELERDRIRAERDQLIENLPTAQVESLEPGTHAAIDRLREDAARAQARERALAQALESSESALAEQSVRVRALEAEILELQAQSEALQESLRRAQPDPNRVPRKRLADLEASLAETRRNLDDRESDLAELHRLQHAIEVNRAEFVQDAAAWEAAVESLRAADAARQVERGQLNAALRERDETVHRLAVQLDASEIETTQLRERIEALSAELATAREEAARLRSAQFTAATPDEAVGVALQEQESLFEETHAALLALDERLRGMEELGAPRPDAEAVLSGMAAEVVRRTREEAETRARLERRLEELENLHDSQRLSEDALQTAVRAAQDETRALRARLEALSEEADRVEHERDTLALERDHLVTERDAAVNETARLRTESDEQARAVETLREEQSTAQARIAEQDAALETLRDELRTREDEIRTLRGDIEESARSAERLSEEHGSLRERLAERETEVEARERDLEELRRSFDQALAREHQATQRAQSQASALALLEHQIAARERELLELGASSETLERDLFNEKSVRETLELELEAGRTRLSEIEQRLDAALQKLSKTESEWRTEHETVAARDIALKEAQNRYDRLESDRAAVAETLSSTELRLLQATETIEALKERIGTGERERGELQKTLHDARKLTAERDAFLEQLREEIQALQGSRDMLSDKVNAAHARMAEQDARLTERSAERDALRRERDELAARVEGLERESRLLHDQEASLRRKLGTAERDLEATQRALADTEQALHTAESRIADLKSMTEELRNDVRGRNTRIAELEAVRKRLEDDFAAGRDREGALQRELESRHSALESLREDLADADAQSLSLERQLYELGAELMRRNHAIEEAGRARETVEADLAALEARVRRVLDEELPHALEDRVAAIRRAQRLEEEIELLRKQIW